MPLTARQQHFLDLLKQFISDRGHAPMLVELKEFLEGNDFGKIASLNSLTQYLDSLECAGLLRRTHKKRGIELPNVSSPTYSQPPRSLRHHQSNSMFSKPLLKPGAKITVGRDLIQNLENPPNVCIGEVLEVKEIVDNKFYLFSGLNQKFHIPISLVDAFGIPGVQIPAFI